MGTKIVGGFAAALDAYRSAKYQLDLALLEQAHGGAATLVTRAQAAFDRAATHLAFQADQRARHEEQHSV